MRTEQENDKMNGKLAGPQASRNSVQPGQTTEWPLVVFLRGHC